jgi:hypothetical protein
MEKSKKTDFSERPIDKNKVDPSCPWWIFGNEESADNDLKEKFEVEDEEDKNK